MKDELGSLDLELKELFMKNEFGNMELLLADKSDDDVKDLTDYNWNIIKNNYEMEKYQVLFQHMIFVAFSCYMVEYSYKRGLIGEEAFQIMMSVYNDIHVKRNGP